MSRRIRTSTSAALALICILPAWAVEPERLPSGAGLPGSNPASLAGVNPLTGEALETGRLRTTLATEQLRTRIEKERLEQMKMKAEARQTDIEAARRAVPVAMPPAPGASAPPPGRAVVVPKPRFTARPPVRLAQAVPPVPAKTGNGIPVGESTGPRLLALLHLKNTHTALLQFTGLREPKEVQVGETVAGYRILSITESGVSVSREPGGTVALLAMGGAVGRLAEADTQPSPLSAGFATMPSVGAPVPVLGAGSLNRPIQPPVPIESGPGYPNPLDIGTALVPPPLSR